MEPTNGGDTWSLRVISEPGKPPEVWEESADGQGRRVAGVDKVNIETDSGCIGGSAPMTLTATWEGRGSLMSEDGVVTIYLYPADTETGRE